MINSVSGVLTGNSERTRIICSLLAGKLIVWLTSPVARETWGSKPKHARKQASLTRPWLPNLTGNVTVQKGKLFQLFKLAYD
jgi:hypothetical protein